MRMHRLLVALSGVAALGAAGASEAGGEAPWNDRGQVESSLMLSEMMAPATPRPLSDGAGASVGGDGVPDWPTRTTQLVIARENHVVMGVPVSRSGTLAETRGGMLTVGGLQVDFSITMATEIDGRPALVSTLSLDQMLGETGVAGGRAATISGADGATTVIHTPSRTGLQSTVINNRQSATVNTMGEVVIDVIGLGTSRRGMPGTGGRPMDLETREAIIRSVQ